MQVGSFGSFPRFPRRLLALAVSAPLLGGCVEATGPFDRDPSAFLREELAARPPHGRGARGTTPSANASTVRCGCDASGDLHVRAPQGSRVTVPEDATFDAEAEIALPVEMTERPRPIRTTRSLGFIGDNKLGEAASSRSFGGPWSAPDALLPAHRHDTARYGHGTGSWRATGYRTYAPGRSW